MPPYQSTVPLAHFALALLILLCSCGSETPRENAPASALQPTGQGREHYIAGRYSQAIAAFETNLVDSIDTDPDIHRQLGRAHLALGRYDTAQSHIIKALLTDRENAELYDILGAIHMGRAFSQAHYRDTDDALTAFQRAIDIDPERGHTLYNMGLVYAYRDSTDLAAQYYRRALKADSTLAPAYKKLGLAARKKGDLEQAIGYLEQTAHYAPEDAEAHFHLGMLHRGQSDFELALQNLERAAELNPHSPQIHSNLAGIYLRLGRRQEGQRALQRSEILRQNKRGIGSEITSPTGAAVAIGPATARYNMALNLALLGRHEEALVEYRNTIELNSDHKDAHSGLGILLTWKGQLDEAAEALRRAVDLDAQDPINRTRLGMVYFKQARLYAAKAELEMALVLDDSLAEASYGLGLIDARQGQMKTAATHFARASDLRPDYAEAFMNLGVARMRLGQLEQAVAAYLKVSALDPDNARVHMYLSDAYGRAGDSLQSTSHRERAHKLGQSGGE